MDSGSPIGGTDPASSPAQGSGAQPRPEPVRHIRRDRGRSGGRGLVPPASAGPRARRPTICAYDKAFGDERYGHGRATSRGSGCSRCWARVPDAGKRSSAGRADRRFGSSLNCGHRRDEELPGRQRAARLAGTRFQAKWEPATSCSTSRYATDGERQRSALGALGINLVPRPSIRAEPATFLAAVFGVVTRPPGDRRHQLAGPAFAGGIPALVPEALRLGWRVPSSSTGAGVGQPSTVLRKRASSSRRRSGHWIRGAQSAGVAASPSSIARRAAARQCCSSTFASAADLHRGAGR
jgi:hypothetical protein